MLRNDVATRGTSKHKEMKSKLFFVGGFGEDANTFFSQNLMRICCHKKGLWVIL
jgi:hypothetical protein